MVNDGDIFLTKLERGFVGAFRVLKANGHLDFVKKEVCLIAITKYVDTKRPDMTDPRLMEVLCDKRFLFRGFPNIYIYIQGKIEKNFEYLGNIPLTKEETKAKIRIGDGEHTEYGGGYSYVGEIRDSFGIEAFWEWRWEHEREMFIKEEEEEEAQRESARDAEKKPLDNSEVAAEAYRFRDDKSDKFWRIEYGGDAMAVNFGKTGTAGRYQVKEFDSDKECTKEAKKLISAKVKKGYESYPEFDAGSHFYFDDEEIGLHPLTSHPQFRSHFKNELYYDCVNEEAPFGSDEGSDTLAYVHEELRKNRSLNFAEFPRKVTEEYWDMEYMPADDIKEEAIEKLVKTNEMEVIQSDTVTYAVAFAQIKTTGRIDPKLKEMALNSMHRMNAVSRILKWGSGEPSDIIMTMIKDLERFPSN